MRADLSKALIDLADAKRDLKKRKSASGRKTPDWAVHEFDKKLLEARDKLLLNRAALELKLKETIHALHESPASESVTYH